MFFIQNHKLHTSVGKLPVDDEILNKNACGNFASIFSVIKNAVFSHHGATCVEFQLKNPNLLLINYY